MVEDASSMKFLVKESLRGQDSNKGKGKEVDGPSVNMTEEGKNKNNKQYKGKKHGFKENNSGSSSNKKPKLECCKCGQIGHFKRDCRSESRDAIFDENCFSSIPRPKDIIPNSIKSQRDDHSNDVPSETPQPRKGKRVRKAKLHGYDFQLYLVKRSRDQKEATNDEIGSIMENNTCVLFDLPPGCKPLGCKGIFKRKIKVDGTIEKFKARLAPKQWHQKFDEVVFSSGFHLNQFDKCVYSKFDSFDKGVIICLYVDEMLIFTTNQNQVDKTKKFLSSKFSMKDMGEVDVILGIKIKRKNKRIVIKQPHYTEKILKKFNHEDCSPVSTPMDPVEKLKPNTCKLVDQLEYSKAIGYLVYAMTSTRPDIAYAVGRLSRFTSNPRRHH
nr:zinc finger, CCHC-type [Tanacetum cinerariifolium]